MDNLEITKKLYNVVKIIDDLHRYDNEVLLLISSIWNIYQSKPTGEDKRYSNLGDEIEKHYFLNDDWNQDKLYVGILKILDDLDKILIFIDGLLKIVNDDEYSKISEFLCATLASLNKKVLHIDNHYIIANNEDIPITGKTNDIPFIICDSTITDEIKFNEVDIKWADEKEYFALTFNYNWNDYSFKTWYNLYYVNNGKCQNIGKLKILYKKNLDTSTFLDKRFYNLDSDFCSLGYSPEYYSNIRKILKDRVLSCLLSLRDISVYTKIDEEFRDLRGYKESLMRANSSVQAWREGRYRVFGRNMSDAYSFTFHYEPKYDVDNFSPQDITFDFSNRCYPFQRVYGLIGENGTGKTSLLYTIVKELISKKKKAFKGPTPIFGSIMMMSYSAFDHEIPKQEDVTIKFVYSGLLKDNGQLYSKEELKEKFISNLKYIIKRHETEDRLLDVWSIVMENFIDKNIIYSFFKPYSEIDKDKINEFCNKMSSGEIIYVYTLTDFIANIRKDTLFLFDEPEQHLHPHAISMLMKGIFELLDMFESYAIIATHSPLIVRELLSNNVYTFSRNEDCLSVAKIGIESFGEDITTISNIVFKNLLDENRFEVYLKQIAKDNNYNFEKTVDALQSGLNKLSLSTRLLLRSIIEQNH